MPIHADPAINHANPAKEELLSRRFNSLRRAKLERYWQHVPQAREALPDGAIDDAAFLGLLARAVRDATPDIGLRVGVHRSIADLGMLGHVTMSCANLAEAAELWRRYADDAGELVALNSGVARGSDTWILRFDPAPIVGGRLGDVLVDELCTSFFRLAEELTGNRFADFVVHLPHAPLEGVAYERYFPGEVRFHAAFGGATGPAEAFGLPIIYRDPEALAALTHRLASAVRGSEGRLPVRLADYFLRNPGRPNATDAAAALGISERTLRRQLASEGESYGRLLETFRAEFGMALLRERMLRPKQIAHALGYRDENSLRRAFKAWTGTSIRAWMRDPDSHVGLERARLPAPDSPL